MSNKHLNLVPLKYINYLRLISSSFALTGGIILASKTSISSYGFIFLAISSFLLFISSLLAKDKIMICYAISIFFGVDLLGVYRWLIN